MSATSRALEDQVMAVMASRGIPEHDVDAFQAITREICEGVRVPWRISVTSGHLTAREKQAISQMLTQDLEDARSARIMFHLDPLPEVNTWRVTTTKSEPEWTGPRRVTYHATIRAV